MYKCKQVFAIIIIGAIKSHEETAQYCSHFLGMCISIHGYISVAYSKMHILCIKVCNGYTKSTKVYFSSLPVVSVYQYSDQFCIVCPVLPHFTERWTTYDGSATLLHYVHCMASKMLFLRTWSNLK